MSTGILYFLHLDAPVGTSRHYTGLTKNLEVRLAQHAAGQGAGVTRRARQLGIGWTLAFTVEPARGLDERAVKRTQALKICPLCGGDPDRLTSRVTGTVLRAVDASADPMRTDDGV